ncbi:MAG: hypothetical protein WD875_18975 [Pirellulales bacterium]
MNDLWLRVIGVSPDRIPEDATRDFLWTHAPQSWGVFVLIAAVLAGALGIFYLYRREISSCPRPARIVLAGLRTLVLVLLLVAVALGPALVYSTRHRIDPVVVVALDDSASMKLADKYLDDDAIKPVAELTRKSPAEYRGQSQLPTRLDLIEQLFAKSDHKAIQDIAAKGKLRVVHFSDRAEIKETKPRYVAPAEGEEKTDAEKTDAGETGGEGKAAASIDKSVDKSDVKWPDLKWVFYGAALLTALLLIVAFFRGSALVALIAALPVTAAFFSLVIFLEANPRWHPLVLLELDKISALAGYEIAEPYAPPEKPKLDEPKFDATIPLPTGVGRSTNLARVIRKVLEGSTGGSEVAALVLVTDGQDNADEGYLAAADEAADRRVPILVLGVGDASRERRIDVATIEASRKKVWREESLLLKSAVTAAGYQGRLAQVQLIERAVDAASGDAGGAEKVVGTKDISLPADGESTPVEFTYVPKMIGKFYYAIKVEVVDDTSADGNRESSTLVEVIDKKAKVLLIAGSPTWEYRTAQVMLQRDKTIDVSCWLQTIKDMPQEGNTVLESMPLTQEELAKFEAVLLFDPDPAEFRVGTGGKQWSEIIKRYVENGGGLLYMPGPKHAGRFITDDATGGIADILPVRFDEPGNLLKDFLSEKYNEPYTIEAVKANLDHPLLRFDVDLDKTEKRWNAMPAMFWSFPALEEKRGSKTLLFRTTGRGDRPLLVAGPPTMGRTAYLGLNGTWRWRRLGNDGSFFTTFWTQMVWYLVDGSKMGSQQRGVIDVPGLGFSPGEKIKFTATIRTPQGDPLTDAQVSAALHSVNDKTVLARTQLKPKEGSPGEFEGEFTATAQGSHIIKIELAGAKVGETVVLESRDFPVAMVDIEARKRQLNRVELEKIAKRSSGQYKGGYFDVNQMSELVAAVPNRGTEKVVPGRPIDLWDTNRLIFILALLLTIEWGARKRFKLM